MAWHAVRRGEVGKRQVAIVIGCGPVGLGVILMLKASGVRTVVASDYSPGRRALAKACGAEVVVDPAAASPFAAVDGGHVDGHPRGPGAGRRHAREARSAARRVVARVASGREARRRAQAPGGLRVRRRAGDDREHRRRGAAVLARRRRRRLRRSRPLRAGDGDQQGDRPALRDRLHAARVPRHAAHARRGQGRSRARSSPAASGSRASTRPSPRSPTPSAHAKILIDPRSTRGLT